MSNNYYSIIICTYNRADILSDAIFSLLIQSFKDWECIIIDDGSIDDTKVVVDKYLKDQRFKYYYKINTGVADSKNFGMTKALGKYITFLDSDDQYKKNHLQSRYEILNKNNPDLLHGGVDIIGSRFVPDKNNQNELISLDDCVIGGTFFIKKELIDLGYRFPIVSYSEDSLLFKDLQSDGKKILKTQLKTYIYQRENPNSICNQKKINSQ